MTDEKHTNERRNLTLDDEIDALILGGLRSANEITQTMMDAHAELRDVAFMHDRVIARMYAACGQSPPYDPDADDAAAGDESVEEMLARAERLDAEAERDKAHGAELRRLAELMQQAAEPNDYAG